MELTIPRATLMKPLQIISGVVEKRQTLPILSNVLVTVSEDTLSLTATDLEIELIGTAPLSQVLKAGKTTVSARKLLDICRALPEDASLEKTLEGEHLVLRSGKSRFALTTMPATDFPKVENGPYTTQFELTESQLRKLFSKTHFAMGQQDVRHYLNGALIDISQGQIKCVATDGHRLAYSVLSDVDVGTVPARVIIPRKSILELIRLLDVSTENKMMVCVGENHFRVITGDFTFSSKLINAQYPEYERLIPKNVSNTALVNREALKQALVRASILSNEKFRGVRLHLEPNELRIVANNPEQEEAEETLALDYAGNKLEIGFNAAYLLDAVSAITSDQVRFSFNDPNSGVLIEPGNSHDALYVVMPMRL